MGRGDGMGRVVVLGSLNVDLVTHVDRHPAPGETVLGERLRRLAGGKGANQAVAAAAAGARVAMVGCVGDDADGAAYVDRLRRKGIDTTGVRVLPGGTTGVALVAVDDEGENTVIVVPGANHALTSDDVDALDLGAGDVLLVQLEVPAPVVCRAIRRAHDRGARTVLNLAPYAVVPPDVIALADPVVANEHEAFALADSGALPRSLLVTLGTHGAVWDGTRWPAVEVPAASVVDTTGAGDAFCGALAAALAAGAGREEAITAALAAGARAVRHHGAQPGPDLGR